jgi:N-methylhydantoinase B
MMGQDENGDAFHRVICVNGGSGGTAETDGHVISFPANIGGTPVEVMESLMPVIWEKKEVIPDSAGAGTHRGGFGQRMICRASRPLEITIVNGRVAHPAPGLLGGGAGRAGRFLVDGRELSAGAGAEVPAGGRFVLEAPGGGGLGTPLARDAEKVQDEVREGLVSIERAEIDYGVSLEPDTFLVDAKRTEALRASRGVMEPLDR